MKTEQTAVSNALKQLKLKQIVGYPAPRAGGPLWFTVTPTTLKQLEKLSADNKILVLGTDGKITVQKTKVEKKTPPAN